MQGGGAIGRACGAAWMLAAGLLPLAGSASAADAPAAVPLDVTVTYIERQVDSPGAEAETVPLPPRGGLEGARIGLKDTAATGKFIGQTWHLDERLVEPDGDFTAAVEAALAEGRHYLVVDGTAEDVLAAADLAAKHGAIVFNSGAPDVRLRDADCRAGLFHTLASRDMLADALTQYLLARRWRRVMLVHGPGRGDLALAEAFRASIAKFKLKLVADKAWSDPAEGRTAAQEIPLVTQGDDYDVVLVADEGTDFGRHFPYQTWLPRPVAGSNGLVPTIWNAQLRGWGAAQLQDRFARTAGRVMDSYDYAAFIAIRSIGEAVTRVHADDTAKVAAALVAPDFAIGGFQGAKASFRAWNGQMRQPIALTGGEGVVAFAPIEGFTHRLTELDTLGIDEPESRCHSRTAGK